MNEKQKYLCQKAYEESCHELLRNPTYADGWAACLESNGIGEEPRIPDGYFKIGEEAECLFREDTKILGKFGFISSDGEKVCFDPAVTIRRIPAWKPKDGEAVLFRNQEGYAAVGVYSGKSVLHDTWAGWPGWDGIIPFDESKRGKPWSEI